MVFSPDGRALASTSLHLNEGLRLWDADTGVCNHILGGPALSIAFSPDSKVLASGLLDAVRLWEVATGSPRQNFAVSGSPPPAVHSILTRWRRSGFGFKSVCAAVACCYRVAQTGF